MADPTDPNYGKPIPGAPIQGTPEAEEFVQSLLRAIDKVEAKMSSEMVPTEELEAFVNKKGLNGLMSNIEKETGELRVFTKPAPKPEKKKMKKRVRVGI